MLHKCDDIILEQQGMMHIENQYLPTICPVESTQEIGIY